MFFVIGGVLFVVKSIQVAPVRFVSVCYCLREPACVCMRWVVFVRVFLRASASICMLVACI